MTSMPEKGGLRVAGVQMGEQHAVAVCFSELFRPYDLAKINRHFGHDCDAYTTRMVQATP